MVEKELPLDLPDEEFERAIVARVRISIARDPDDLAPLSPNVMAVALPASTAGQTTSFQGMYTYGTGWFLGVGTGGTANWFPGVTGFGPIGNRGPVGPVGIVPADTTREQFLQTPTSYDMAAIRLQRKRDGHCLECGDRGEWRTMMLMCTMGHGRICG